MGREPFRFRPKQVWSLAKQSGKEWAEDKAPKTAAALAYYLLFALGPLLLIAAGLAGIFFGAAAARDAITAELGGLIGHDAGETIGGLMEAGFRGGSGVFALALGVGLLLFGAVGAFAQLREGLNQAWEVEAKTVRGFWKKIKLALRQNVLSFAAVVGLGFLLVVSLLLSTAVTALSALAEGVLPYGEALWQTVNVVASVLITAVAFILVYRYLSDARVSWRDASVGGAITAVLFVAGQYAIGFYLGQSAMAARYGAVSAIPILLLWLYYTSMIILFGAEVTQVYANQHGAAIRPRRWAEPLEEAVAKRHEHPSREGTERRPGKPSERPT